MATNYFFHERNFQENFSENKTMETVNHRCVKASRRAEFKGCPGASLACADILTSGCQRASTVAQHGSGTVSGQECLSKKGRPGGRVTGSWEEQGPLHTGLHPRLTSHQRRHRSVWLSSKPVQDVFEGLQVYCLQVPTAALLPGAGGGRAKSCSLAAWRSLEMLW